jgi:hypothetical protein
VTITVRDQRMREHDPILGVVPLKLSDILQTSSQVTRWYPLDGGIGFGRIRISVLFRSIETRLPINQLGWDVGTVEFTSDKLLAIGYNKTAKIKMRTGGSSGSIGRVQCQKLEEGDGVYWDIAKKEGKYNVRLPVRYRYRSPVIFEFHTSGRRSADAYAVIWLHHLEDNKEATLNIPIWKTDKGMRLTQNYVTEENFKDIPDIKIEEIGRLQFSCRFKAGTDEDHSKFVSDNDSRETQETWEACHSEGVRGNIITKELPPAVQELHDQSLTQGRDILASAEDEDKKKWLSKDGTDWSGAFGEDPAKYADFKGAKRTRHDSDRTGDGSNRQQHNEEAHGSAYSDTDESSSDSDLGIVGADSNGSPSQGSNDNTDFDGSADAKQSNGPAVSPQRSRTSAKEDKKDMHRKQRGLMQWKPMRNLAFAKNEAKFAVRRTLKRGELNGRQPGVESEY